MQVLGMGHPDWWKVSVFHQEEYWELKEKGYIRLPVEICSAKLNEIIEEI